MIWNHVNVIFFCFFFCSRTIYPEQIYVDAISGTIKKSEELLRSGIKAQEHRWAKYIALEGNYVIT